MNAVAKKGKASYMKKWRAKNKEKVNGYLRNWRMNNKDKVAEYQERYWEKKWHDELSQAEKKWNEG